MPGRGWLGAVGILVAWQSTASLGLLSPTLLASPTECVSRFWTLFATGSIVPDLAVTLGRMLAGYLAACVVGVLFGLAIGNWKWLYDVVEFPLDFFRSLPVTTLYPLFVLMFGIGHMSKIAMVFTASVFVIILNSAYGVRQSNPTRRDMARLFGASRLQVFFLVTVWEAMPQTVIGLRVALSYSLIVEIVCEMFMGAQRGVGQRVFEAYNTYSIDELYAIVLIVGVLGYLMNRAFVAIEVKLLPWVTK